MHFCLGWVMNEEYAFLKNKMKEAFFQHKQIRQADKF